MRLLTAFCELLASHATTADVIVGTQGEPGKTLVLRIACAEISDDRVRSAWLDALEHRLWSPNLYAPAMFFPDRADGAALALTPDGFVYDPGSYNRDAIASFAEEFQALLDPPPPFPNRLLPTSAVAIRSRQGDLTYAQLLGRAQRLAHRLIRRGLKPYDLAALELDRSADLVAAILGIWQAGAAYLPIDPAFPESRKKFLFQDSGAALTVTASDFDDLDSEPPQAYVAVEPDSLAYVIYTSGSTGEPKGVPITHRAFNNFLESVRRKTGIGPADHFVAVTTLAFDIAAMELLLPLAAGASLALTTRDDSANGLNLKQILEEQQATIMFGTPATWRLLLDAGWQGNPGFTALCGGEAMTRALADLLLPKTRALWNMYGPTETTIASTMARVEPGSGAIPIGRALSKTQLYVRHGELWIGGVGVAAGYLNRPELTAAKFTADGLFRTGDLARFLLDGNLEFLGRTDDQLNLRGFRIEPGEIEAALLRLPEVRQAAVLRQADTLAAFVTPTQPTGLLRDQLAAALPSHMVPDKITALETFPLTPNGKVDRRALSEYQPTDSVVTYTAPANAVERALAAIFGEVLHLERVSATANFFHLGGHSLLAAQALARVWDLWRVKMPTRVLFEAPSVQLLGVRIQALQGSLEPAAPRRTRSLNPPLSYEQERFWLLHAFHREEQALYNIPAMLRLTGPLDPERLTRALNDVIARHEPFRAQFQNVEGVPVQTVLPVVCVAIPIRTAEAGRTNAGRPFDLSQAPLLRASLTELAPGEWEFLLTLHHIVADGWSMGVLFHDLSAAYRGVSLPALFYQYSDYAQDQREDRRSFHEDAAFWREQLAGLGAPLELPTDRPRGDMLSYRGAQFRFEWKPELAAELLAFSRQEGVTPFITLLSAFQILLHSYTGVEDLVVGTPVANRNRIEVEPLIGPFLNTLPIRARIAPADSFRHILKRTHQTALDAFAHGELPFQKMMEELKPERSLAHTPFFQVMFALQNAATNGLDLPGIQVSEVRYEPEWVKLDLSVNIEQIEPAFRGSIDYNRDLFDRARIERWAADLGSLLELALENPDRTVALFGGLGAAIPFELSSDYPRLAGQQFAADHFNFSLETNLVKAVEHFAATEGLPPTTVLSAAFTMLLARYMETATHDAFRHAVHRVHGIAQRDLTLAVGPAVLRIDYNAALFNHARIERMSGHFAQLLKAGIAAPETIVTKLSFLTAPELAQFEEWNRTETSRPSGTYLQSFARHVLETPDRVAVECANQTLTYAELDQEASKLAGSLKPDGLTVVLAKRDIRIIPQLLATWMAGGAYAPLDPDYPVQRLDFIRQDLNSSNSAAGLAYVTYTSGSTGKPKGVPTRPEPLLNLLEAMRIAVPVDRSDVMLAVTSAAFDMSIPELWLPLYCGAKVVLATDQDRQDPERLRALLERTGVTVMQSTPSLAGALLDAGWVPARGFKLLAGAESIPRQLADRLIAAGCTLWNIYGPTEICVWCTMARLTGGEVSIGRPIANTRVYVLDRNGEPVPIGIPGELYIAGAGVAHGYWNRPELTAEKFVTLGSGERAYRTGDLVRFREDGELVFLRRLDTQVKVSGFRIELGEVETAISEIPGITAAAAAIREDSLYAWYTGATQVDPSAHLAAILPGYMVPRHIFAVRTLPRNVHGKLDRDALQIPTAPASISSLQPESALERKLLCIWREVLSVPDLTVTDSFFDHGGESLSAMRLTARVEKESGETLPLYRLFTAPTVRAAAAYLEAQSLANVPAGLNGIQPRGARAPIFFFNVTGGCWNLAHALGPDQPLLGIEQDADAVAAIRARQSHGPYLLAGSEIGSEAALATARRLADLGETVSAVVLLDAARPNRWHGLFSKVSQPSTTVIHFRSADLPSSVFESPAVEQIARTMRQFT